VTDLVFVNGSHEKLHDPVVNFGNYSIKCFDTRTGRLSSGIPINVKQNSALGRN